MPIPTYGNFYGYSWVFLVIRDTIISYNRDIPMGISRRDTRMDDIPIWDVPIWEFRWMIVIPMGYFCG